MKEKPSLNDSKLIEILKSLSKQEFKRLDKFIRSPFFNEGPKLIKLYDFFKKNYSNNDLILKEDLGNFIYKGEKNYDVKLRKLISDFTKILKFYILNLEMENSKLSHNNLLLKICNNRNLPKTFNQTLIESRKENENLKNRDPHYYFHNYYLELESFRFGSGRLKDPGASIKKVSDSADNLFLFEKLICIYNINTLRNSFNKIDSSELSLTSEVIDHIKQREDHYSKNHIIIFTYYLSSLMAMNINEKEYFFRYKTFVLTNRKKFSPLELHTFYLMMYSYSIQKVNKGDKSFMTEMMDVFKFIDKNVKSVRYMFGFNIYYLNAVNTGMALKEHAWVEKFMNKNKEYLPKENREDVFNLGMANFYFFRKNYDEALNFLIRSDYPNYTYYLMAKILLIKIYFEKDDYEGVLSTIDAMKHYLKRKDLIPERLIRSNSNFLNCVIKLIDRNKKNSILNAERMAKEDMSISNREWIIEKIRETN